MAPVTLEKSEGAWLDSHAKDWVAAGLISAEQAELIRHHEQPGEAAPAPRLPLVAEVAAYIGSVLALMGGAAVVGPEWEGLALIGRLGLALGLSVVGFLTGTWLVRLAEDGTTRLGSFLWTIGTGGIALATVALVQEMSAEEGGATALVAGLTVLAVSIGLWRNLDRPLQLVTAGAGFAIGLAGLSDLTLMELWVGGTVLVVAGLGLAVVAAVTALRPRLTALMLGALSAWVGGFMLSDINEHLGPALALAVAVAAVAYALRDRLIPLLTLGVVGALIATQVLLATTFTGAVSALLVSVAGLVIVVTAIVRARSVSR